MSEIPCGTEIRPAADACPYEPPRDSCLMVILGASGDLTARKILPALYRLFCSGFLPESFAVLGCGRSFFTDDGFRSRMREALDQAGAALERWAEFSEMLYYQQLDYDRQESFAGLARTMHDIADARHTGAHRLFYLATPPFLFEQVISMLGQCGLAREKARSWTRIVVEKPFGSDLASAMRLDAALRGGFHERQVYRIDHYLAKETVQNIIAFRLANAILEPLWNGKHIDYIDICALETIGIEHRAGYYEKAGVLRDMFQNHMLQLLSLVAMEPPAQFEPEAVRNRKAQVFKCLRPFDPATIPDHIVLGQYGEGIINEQLVPAYRNEKGVDPQSVTPTFACMRVFVDNRRWDRVPFYLTSGKRMRERLTRIIIQFKDVRTEILRNFVKHHGTADRLVFMIQPQEKITLSLRAKNPGAAMCLRSIDLEFSYEGDRGSIFEAYEKVLLDCLKGDQMLALRQDSEELCWAFLTPLIEDCERCIRTERILYTYPAGSWGPAEVSRVRQCG